jgi:hypothetical protein
LRGGIEEKMIMLPQSNKDAAHEDMELDIPDHIHLTTISNKRQELERKWTLLSY